MGLAGTRGSSAVTLVALAGVAVALAWALRLLGDQPIVFDSSQYVSLGRLLASGQVTGWTSRTYGYPAFLVPWLLPSASPCCYPLDTIIHPHSAATARSRSEPSPWQLR